MRVPISLPNSTVFANTASQPESPKLGSVELLPGVPAQSTPTFSAVHLRRCRPPSSFSLK